MADSPSLNEAAVRAVASFAATLPDRGRRALAEAVKAGRFRARMRETGDMPAFFFAFSGPQSFMLAESF
jgi:hypothetical protein